MTQLLERKEKNINPIMMTTSALYQALKDRGFEVDLNPWTNRFHPVGQIYWQGDYPRDYLGELKLAVVDKEKKVLESAAVMLEADSGVDMSDLPVLSIQGEGTMSKWMLAGREYKSIHDLGVAGETVWYDTGDVTTFLEKPDFYP